MPPPQKLPGLIAVCGRYAAVIPAMDLAAAFGIRPENVLDDLEPSYNVAPTDPVPAVLTRSDGSGGIVTELRAMHWGLVPWWASDIRGAARRINARVETVAERPAYRAALASRRCLLPADGYYEWTTVGSRSADRRKQPFFLHPRDSPSDGFLAFAGLYEQWRDPTGKTRWTCTILTAAAAGPLAALHDRTPMVVQRGSWQSWLDPAVLDPAAVLRMPIPATELLDAHPVHPRIGNVREAGSHLIEPVGAVHQP